MTWLLKRSYRKLDRKTYILVVPYVVSSLAIHTKSFPLPSFDAGPLEEGTPSDFFKLQKCFRLPTLCVPSHEITLVTASETAGVTSRNKLEESWPGIPFSIPVGGSWAGCSLCVCVCVCVCVCARASACVRACVRTCVRAGVRVCVWISRFHLYPPSLNRGTSKVAYQGRTRDTP